MNGIISSSPHSSRLCSCSLKKSWGGRWLSCDGLLWWWWDSSVSKGQRGNRSSLQPSILSDCIWLQVICPQQSDMYIYREQLVRAICSTFSLPFHNWNLPLFSLWFFAVIWKLLQLYYIQRKHGVESHLQFCPRVNLKILQIPVLRHA